MTIREYLSFDPDQMLCCGMQLTTDFPGQSGLGAGKIVGFNKEGAFIVYEAINVPLFMGFDTLYTCTLIQE